jgi:hypothetical protein
MTFKKESNLSTTQEFTPEKVSQQEEYANPACERLLRSKELLHRGDYPGSLKESQRVLSLPGKNPPKDQALDFFKRVVKDYPKSPLAEEAKAWAGVLQENEKLSQMIEKSKQVDIAVEEKKREKAR